MSPPLTIRNLLTFPLSVSVYLSPLFSRACGLYSFLQLFFFLPRVANIFIEFLLQLVHGETEIGGDSAGQTRQQTIDPEAAISIFSANLESDVSAIFSAFSFSSKIVAVFRGEGQGDRVFHMHGTSTCSGNLLVSFFLVCHHR